MIGVKDPLEQIVFEVSYGCNAGCHFCYNCWKAPGYERGAELAPSDYRRLRGRLPAAKLYALSGGEPLMRRDLFEIADALGEDGTPLSLLTNGIDLDERAADALAERNIVVQLPVHGLRDGHDGLMGRVGAFAGMVRACALLKDRHLSMTTSTVASTANLDSLERALELCVALGSRFLLLIRFLPGGAGLERRDLMLDLDGVRRAYGALESVCDAYGVRGGVGVPNLPCMIDEELYPHVQFSSCLAGRDWFVIDPSGRLRMCNHSPTVYGRPLEEDLAHIVGNRTLRCLEEGTVYPSQCEGCSRVLDCRGGCRAVAETMYGDIRAPDPLLDPRVRGDRPDQWASARPSGR